MTQLGYLLSSEEHPPATLIENARRAEDVGFAMAMLSDHFHPWTLAQGQASFAWSVLGAIAASTSQIRIATGVTCPIMRMHPAIVAHASATIAAMAPGRFMLGVGTGEALNEHITGQRWPSDLERLDRLTEAIEIIRELWTGQLVSRDGRYFTVDRARLTTLPERPPQLLVAASGPRAAELAARNDGLIAPGPIASVAAAFAAAGGADKPRIAQLRACFGPDADDAKDMVMRFWPNGAYSGAMHTDLATPEDFEEARTLVRPDLLNDVIVGPDPGPYLEAIHHASANGFDHVVLHQIGPDQENFLGFFENEIKPTIADERADTLQVDRMVEETFPASDPIATWAGADRMVGA